MVCGLLCDDEVVAQLELADRRLSRTVGLVGRRGIDGALLITNTTSVHTFGMRFGIDVAFVDHDYRVVRVATLRPNRITRFVAGAAHVVEAEAGSFAQWGVEVGSTLRPEQSLTRADER